ncbi:MAG: hypothetical protein JW839_00955 [Candidatus Lokiarchaeota archaeon]|nr:hypothetical protein [Candidatus Lokiarchaeota archaeon]
MILQDAVLRFAGDLLFTLRFLCPLILLYLGYRCGKHAKEVGIVSTMTGFTIYMVGLASFQFGTLLHTEYLELDTFYIPDFKKIPAFPSDFMSVYNLSNYVYVFGMVGFVVLTEVNLTRVKRLKYPGQLKYFFSILSISIQILLVALRMFDIVRKGIFFIVQAVPMVIMSWLYLSHFNRLLAVRRKRLVWIFYAGMLIGGFSNFLQGFEDEWAYSVNAIVVLVGAFMQAWSWGEIPSLTELNWLLGLRRLIVIKRGSSVTLFEHVLDITDDAALAVITGAAFGGMSQLLKEILASDEDVSTIEQGGMTVYFSNQEMFTTILTTSAKSEEYGYRLTKFGIEFGRKYNETLKDWQGDVSVFEGSKTIISETFD